MADHPTQDPDLDEAIRLADLDALIRLIDARGAHHDWEGIAQIRTACRAAMATGRQLWPAAALAEYRLVLWAPAPVAAPMLTATADVGSLNVPRPGPLTEVIAQQHTWAELEPLLTDPILRTYVAHERVLRGEDLSGLDPAETELMGQILPTPLHHAAWEPAYRLPTYTDQGLRNEPPPAPRPTTQVRTTPAVALVDDQADAVREAWLALVRPWLTESNGTAQAVGTEGDVDAALGALGVDSARIVEVPTPLAVEWLMWAGAEGGAHGRRRGGAAGRDAMWWLLGAIGDLTDDWPPTTEDMATEMDALMADLRWWWWESTAATPGWGLRIVCQDAPHGVTWAFAAHDAV